MAYSIPHIHTVGNHYETGFQIGKEFQNRIKQFIRDFKELQTQIIPFIKSHNGILLLKKYSNLIESKYPWYLDEMKGITDGSEIDFSIILALNFRVELMFLTGEEYKTEDTGKECSDFFLVDSEHKLLGHNEDSVSSVYKTCYLVTSRILSKDYNGVKSPEENFTSYCYPGHLPGNAFGFNSNGFAFTLDACYPKFVNFKAFPRQIINRIIMSAKNLTDLESILLYNPISYGVCVNVAFFGNDLNLLKSNWNQEYISDEIRNLTTLDNVPLFYNYELAPTKHSDTNIVSKLCIITSQDKKKHESVDSYYAEGYYYHFNHYERYKTPECVNISSRRRKIRADKLHRPTNLKEFLETLSDNGDEKYPIFRDIREDDPIELKTISTAVFDCSKKTLSIYVNRPIDNEGYKPFIEISMR